MTSGDEKDDEPVERKTDGHRVQAGRRPSELLQWDRVDGL